MCVFSLPAFLLGFVYEWVYLSKKNIWKADNIGASWWEPGTVQCQRGKRTLSRGETHTHTHTHKAKKKKKKKARKNVVLVILFYVSKVYPWSHLSYCTQRAETLTPTIRFELSTTTCTMSCYGNRQTATSPSSVWSCHVDFKLAPFWSDCNLTQTVW